MTRPLSLQDFGAAGDGARPAVPQSDGVVAEPNLEAFEKGYQNGWDDCIAAEVEERGRIGADLAAALRDAGASYEAARADVLRALEPLFAEITAHFLPALAHAALAPTVAAELAELARAATPGTVEILAAPGVQAALERLIDETDGLNATVTAEPAYAGNQVSLRVGAEQRDIDLDAVNQKIAAAIAAFLAEQLRGDGPPQATPRTSTAQGAA